MPDTAHSDPYFADVSREFSIFAQELNQTRSFLHFDFDCYRNISTTTITVYISPPYIQHDTPCYGLTCVPKNDMLIS